jgi:hypothetical protein
MPSGADYSVGIFRLRMPIRFALRHAPHKMTERELVRPHFRGCKLEG